MKDMTFFRKADQVGLVLCVAFLGTLTGCISYVEGPRAGIETTFVAQDDYVYYPSYECYYSVSRHLYAYREGNAWVARPAPRGVPPNVLRASPSVRMDFHDSPAHHHAMVVKQYPPNWSPAGSKHPGPKHPGQQEDPRNGHGERDGK